MSISPPGGSDAAAKRLSHSDGKFGGVQIKNFGDNFLVASRDIVKVAIEVPHKNNRYLYEINGKESLQANITDFCQRNSVTHPELYSLKNSDTNQYITELNRKDMKNGNLLRLAHSPEKVVVDILESLKLNENSDQHKAGLVVLLKESSDVTFAEKFISKKGLNYLIREVESQHLPKKDLGYALTAILELVDHGIVDINQVITSAFIKYISFLVADKNSENIESLVLQRALGILELAVINSNQLYSIISDEIKVQNLISHLQNSNIEIQQSTIALINSLFMKGPTQKSKMGGRRQISDTMAQKQFRTIIKNHLIRSGNKINSEMAHQLYVLQVLTLNTLEERMMSKLLPSMTKENKELHDLYLIAIEPISQEINNAPSKKQLNSMAYNASDLRKLGFTNLSNPVLDFQQTPPGLLSLDFMSYFAHNKQDAFNKLILENNSKDEKNNCPFVKASISIAKTLCTILRIGTQPTVTGHDFYPMFFTNDHPVEEFFCQCIILFNKTWKEMSAIKEDFDKVLSVVCDQIKTSLDCNPQNLDNFKQKLPSYSAILKKREQQLLDKDDLYSKATPVLELRKRLTPFIDDLIVHNRLNEMKRGAKFHKITSKRRDHKSQWVCRLSQNGKYLHYGDVKDADQPVSQTEVLPNSIAIHGIKDLATGKNNPYFKNVSKNNKLLSNELIFTVVYDHDETLHFVAPDYQTWSTWIDGIGALLGRSLFSKMSREDFEHLMRTEVKLHLLDLENITIPEKQPLIPSKLPADYHFAIADF